MGQSLTIQKTPTIAPQIIAKNTVSPYDVAGSQNAKHDNPHAKVSAPAVSMRLHRSLAMPMTGRPIAVPRFRKPIRSVACALENPIDNAKSDRLKRSTTYPSMLVNAHASNSSTSSLLSSLMSKASCGGWITLFRSRMMVIAAKMAMKAMIPVIRSDQAILIDWIMASEPHANATPPTPEPAALIPLARLRFFTNHCESIGRLGM